MESITVLSFGLQNFCAKLVFEYLHAKLSDMQSYQWMPSSHQRMGICDIVFLVKTLDLFV